MMKKLMRSKIFWAVVIIVVVIRIVAPLVVLRKLNAYLAEFSPIYAGHVDSLALGVFRGAYEFRDFELRLKDKPDELFLRGRSVDVSLAWRELFKGHITTDVELDGLQVLLTSKVTSAFKNAPKQAEEDTRAAGKKLFPVRVERLDLKDSSFEFAELISIPDSKRWRLTGIEGRVSNVTPNAEVPLMFVTLSGALFNAARVKLVAQVNQQVSPAAWDADLELKDFELKEANAWMKRKLPLTFTSGKLDLFGEARSLPNGLEGYVKPFLKKADIVADHEAFSGLKHFGIEVSVAAANLILRTSREKTMATKVLFSYENGDFKMNSAKAIAEAFKNGFSDPLPSGIDDEITLSKGMKEAVKKNEAPKK